MSKRAKAAAGWAQQNGDSDEAAGSTDSSEPSDTDSDEDSAPKPARKRSGAAAAASGPRKKTSSKSKAAPKGIRIGSFKAKKTYGLDDNDLRLMTDVKYTQGFGPFASRMYSPRELEEYARKKHAADEGFIQRMDAAKQELEDKRARKRGYRATYTARAAEAVTQYISPNKAIEVEQYGTFKLPDAVVVNIMTALANTREPGGLRGYACVAQDLANAALASWDFYRAAKAGFAALAAAAAAAPPKPCGPRPGNWRFIWRGAGGLHALPGPPELGGWEFWSQLLRDPMSLKGQQLKDAMKLMGISVKGTKAEMALMVLGVFRLKAATTAPVQLLRAVGMERSAWLAWDGPDPFALHARVRTAIGQLMAADSDKWAHLAAAQDKGVAAIRVAITAAGFSSIDAFVQAAAEAAEQQREQQRQQQELQLLQMRMQHDEEMRLQAEAAREAAATQAAAMAAFEAAQAAAGQDGDDGLVSEEAADLAAAAHEAALVLLAAEEEAEESSDACGPVHN